ncbi:YqgE/AlgH family protein [Candidatus Albibeggiatoa sp. nov. NOAA]|uniref:YqgE/AlgH family protein n=1 Tax=Candidatus Albibeggiatoa sp. nov. NOAA TaxID=3162724 RepID=UPI003304FE36|nr:YqgE/AlgH family protein [Thiotrichaceae bacterium]
MIETTYLTNHLLIAMPNLDDPHFAQTVTYVCMHNDDGAMGIIINRPISGVDVGQVLEHMEIESHNPVADRMPVFDGGPVQKERGFVLHEPSDKNWDAMLILQDQMAITTSQDILQAMADGSGPDNVLIALGYAGWSAGQLEQEMLENTWLSIPANDNDIIFNIPAENRWQAAASKLGIDINLLSTQAGHS